MKTFEYIEVDVKKTNKPAITIMNDWGKKGYRLVLQRLSGRLLYFEKQKG